MKEIKLSKINIFLPFKEKFSNKTMSSVSISVKANIEKSIFKNELKIFGQYVDDPIFSEIFIGIKKPFLSFRSKNLYLAKKMCSEINHSKIESPIVEIHNRPYIVKLINKNIKKAKVILFFHNDPLEMKGSKSVNDRLSLINECAAICFVSKYIKKQFLTDIKVNPKNTNVIYNGISKAFKKCIHKEKNIIFIGRLVEEKGAHLFLEASKILSKKYKSWNFTLIGSPNLGSNKKETSYSRKIFSTVKELGPNVKLTGYLPHNQAQKIIQKASIMVVPSIWPEPFGLVVAEGMMYGCAIIASQSGGIPEIIEDKGIVLEKLNISTILNAIELLINDNILRKKYQENASHDFSFSSEASSKSLDRLRKKILLQ